MPAADLTTLFNFRPQITAHFANLLDTAGLPNVLQRYASETEKTPEIVVDARVREQTRTQRAHPTTSEQIYPHYRGQVTVLITAPRKPKAAEHDIATLEAQVRATMSLIGASLPSLATIEFVWWREGPSLDASEILFGARQAGLQTFKDDVLMLAWDCEWFIKSSEWPV